MAKFYPIIFVHGWGGPGDIIRDFGAADERDPYVGWSTGHRFNDPDGWIKFRNTELNFEGLALRLVKNFNYYDASNDEEPADSGALVDKAARASAGVVKSREDLPHLLLEYNAFRPDERVGGKALASGFKMVPLIEETRVMSMEGQVMQAKLRVEVKRR